MIIYRPHRGGLAESMREKEVFDSESDMKAAIVHRWHGIFDCNMFDESDIVVNWNEPGVFDERTGWEDTRYVCVKRMGSEVYAVPQCIGMCATKFPCAFSVRYLCVDAASSAETAK